MTDVLYVGDRAIRTDTIPTLLKRYELLPKFIEELAIDEAIEEYDCTAEEKQQALLEICQRYKLTNLEEQQQWMEERGLNASEVEVMATRSRRIQKFKEAKWGRKVRRYFMERKPSLDAVIYSLIRTQDAGLAHELYYRILEGEITFEQCAATYSQGPEARTGGKMGPVPLNRPHPIISKLLSVSQPGQLWPPRVISDWHIIIRLEDIQAAQLDDATRQALIDELYGTWLQERVQALMAQVLSPEQQAESAAIAAAPAQPASEPEADLQDLDHDSLSPDTVTDTPESVTPVLDNSEPDNPELDNLESDMVVIDAPDVDDAAAAGIVLEDLDDLDDAHPNDSTPNAPQSLVSTSA